MQLLSNDPFENGEPVSHLDVDGPLCVAGQVQKTELSGQVPGPVRAKASKLDGAKEMHITCQFRDGPAMVYDLKAGERRFEIRIRASTRSQGAWGVAMLAKDGVERAPVDAVGPTRLLALEALERGSGSILGREDWIGIRKALTEVRAL
jgi:hypothetical protein